MPREPKRSGRPRVASPLQLVSVRIDSATLAEIDRRARDLGVDRATWLRIHLRRTLGLTTDQG